MRIACLASILAYLGASAFCQATVTYSNSSGEANASYSISSTDPGDPGDPGDPYGPPPGGDPIFPPPGGDPFFPAGDIFSISGITTNQAIDTMPTPPFDWWVGTAYLPVDSYVHASASMYAIFQTLTFSGSGYSSAQADSYDSLAIASTSVSFDFTLDQSHSFSLTTTVQRNNAMSFAQITITDSLSNSIAANILDASDGPQVLDLTGVLPAGTYHFSGFTSANYGNGEQTAQLDYEMSFIEVPEPTNLSLLALGSLMLIRRRNRR